MSTPLLDRMRELNTQNNWDAVLAGSDEILATTGPAAERAEGLHILARAHWNLARDAWDLALGITYALRAARLDSRNGQVLWALGIRLVTLGRYSQGRRILKEWLARFHEWDWATQRHVADVQYTLGYAARYEGHLVEAETWYLAAARTYAEVGSTDWSILTRCALAQVLARQGRTMDARLQLDAGPLLSPHGAYRLKALVEVLAAEGDIEAACHTGEAASAALFDLNDDDPWELAELHLLLADLQLKAGRHEEKERHLILAMEILRQTPRHDLYRVACTLLDYDYAQEEVS